MNKETRNTFAKWLEILQQESWQLELLISGFAIFLLLGAYEPINNLEYQIDLLSVADDTYQVLKVPYGILLGAWYVLVVNLILHVLLRGLWISTIGLRYVSGDIDFESLNLNIKFSRFLKRRIVNFDVYIERLEKLCSIIFAFTFLIIFSLISAGLILGWLVVIALMISWVEDRAPDFVTVILAFLILFYLLGALIYFLDFITLGFFKRQKLFSRLYFPIYRFFSFATLAFIYRPLYYNLIDNRFGRRVVLFLIPYLLILLVVTSVEIRSHGFLPDKRQKQSINNASYEDTSPDERLSYTASIPSKYVENGFVELYLPYNPDDDDETIQAICPDLKPMRKGTRLNGLISINLNGDDDEYNYDMNADSALLCNAARHQIYVNDSLFNDPTYRFHNHPTRQTVGLLTVLDVNYLPRGEHKLKVRTQFLRWRKGRDTLIYSQSALIPFWKK